MSRVVLRLKPELTEDLLQPQKARFAKMVKTVTAEPVGPPEPGLYLRVSHSKASLSGLQTHYHLVAWPGIWVSDQPPANSCMLQFEANLPVTALLQGSKGHG